MSQTGHLLSWRRVPVSSIDVPWLVFFKVNVLMCYLPKVTTQVVTHTNNYLCIKACTQPAAGQHKGQLRKGIRAVWTGRPQNGTGFEDERVVQTTKKVSGSLTAVEGWEHDGNLETVHSLALLSPTHNHAQSIPTDGKRHPTVTVVVREPCSNVH
jgi:hypothetical protein